MRRDGIHFQRLRYLDLSLAAYIGEDVVIRYDPRDMAEIRVYYQNEFLCRAVCQELADQTVSLQEIVRARNRRRRELRGTIKKHAELLRLYLDVHTENPIESEDDTLSQPSEPNQPTLKRYHNE